MKTEQVAVVVVALVDVRQMDQMKSKVRVVGVLVKC